MGNLEKLFEILDGQGSADAIGKFGGQEFQQADVLNVLQR